MGERSDLIKGIMEVSSRVMKRLGKQVNVKKPSKSKMSKKNWEILKALEKADWGCQKNNVWNLISKVVGFDFYQFGEKTLECGDSWPEFIGAVVVPTSNPNSHSYILGEPVIIRGLQREAITLGGKYGNHLPPFEDGLRLANPKEIEKFFEGMKEEMGLYDLKSVAKSLKKSI
jgi:hypothetical protein